MSGRVSPDPSPRRPAKPPGVPRTTGRITTFGVTALLGGTASALVSALVTVVLLLINGSFSLVLFRVIADADSDWTQRKAMLQFGLFTLPLILLVAQWMAWDLLRGLFVRRSPEEERWNST